MSIPELINQLIRTEKKPGRFEFNEGVNMRTLKKTNVCKQGVTMDI